MWNRCTCVAETSELPELKRVIVSSGGDVAWSESFEGALALLLGRPVIAGTEPAVAPEAGVDTAAAGATPDVAALVSSAQNHWDSAQEALRAGDWATYGEEMNALQADLTELVGLTKGSQ